MQEFAVNGETQFEVKNVNLTSPGMLPNPPGTITQDSSDWVMDNNLTSELKV